MLYIYVCGIIALHGISAKSVDDSPAIVGGKIAEDGQFPYQVSVRYQKKHNCGGSIINKRWILTAAHCLSGFEDDSIDVLLGTNTLDNGGEVYPLEQSIFHSEYDPESIKNDIGLIKLGKDISFSDKVKPIDLPTEDFTKADYPATLSGWGLTSFPGDVPNELYYIQLTVIDQNKCEEEISLVTETNICTLDQKGKGSCRGDSGGPLVADDKQIGIVSFGALCARGKPDGYTRVYSYLDWINEHTQEESRKHTYA